MKKTMQLLEALKSFWLILLSIGTKLSDPEFWELSAYFVENFTDKIKVNLEEDSGSFADFTLESSLDKTKNNILAIVKKLKEQNKPNIKISEAKIKKRTGGLKKYKSTFAPARPNTPEQFSENNYETEDLYKKLIGEEDKFDSEYNPVSIEEEKSEFIDEGFESKMKKYGQIIFDNNNPVDIKKSIDKSRVKRKEPDIDDFENLSMDLTNKLFERFSNSMNEEEYKECKSLSKQECCPDKDDEKSKLRREKMNKFVGGFNIPKI